MSIETSAWAKRQRTGSPANRAVLVELANWANPNGEVQFRRVSDIAAACEMSERQAQRIIAKLEMKVEDGGLGLIKRERVFSSAGAQKANAFRLVGYRKEGDNMSPSPRDKMSPPQGDKMTPTGVTKRHRGGDTHVTGEGDTDVTPYKELDLDPNTPLTPRSGGRKPRFQFPDDWKAPALADLPPAAQIAACAWPEGAYAGQAEAFALFNRGKGRTAADWKDLWAAWIAQKHETVMRSAKAGSGYTAPSSASSGGAASAPKPETAAKSREDARSAEVHEALSDVLGTSIWENWWRPVAIIIDDDCLTVVAPTSFHRNWIEEKHAVIVRDIINGLGWNVEHVRWEVKAPKKGAHR